MKTRASSKTRLARATLFFEKMLKIAGLIIAPEHAVKNDT